MIPSQQLANATAISSTPQAVHLILTEGEMKLMAKKPEQVMEEIRLQATKISTVLEGILLETHGQQHWGLNE